MSRFFPALLLFLCSISPGADQPANRSLLGFTRLHSDQQRVSEQSFDASLRAGDLQAYLKRLSARPHHVGSPYDKQNAEFIASQFTSWGFDTKIEEFYVLFPTPKSRLLELVEPTHYVAKLTEPPVGGDST